MNANVAQAEKDRAAAVSAARQATDALHICTQRHNEEYETANAEVRQAVDRLQQERREFEEERCLLLEQQEQMQLRLSQMQRKLGVEMTDAQFSRDNYAALQAAGRSMHATVMTNNSVSSGMAEKQFASAMESMRQQRIMTANES